jgi:hypothetical protein
MKVLGNEILLIHFLFVVRGNIERKPLPELEEAKLLWLAVFDKEKRNELDNKVENEENLSTLYWMIHKLVGSIVGGRWKPLDTKHNKKDKNKQSFCDNVSNSDIGFALYLLKYYNKLPNDKQNIRKPRMNHKDMQKTIAEYTTYCNGKKNARQSLGMEEKEVIDEWVMKLIKNEIKKAKEKKQ